MDGVGVSGADNRPPGKAESQSKRAKLRMALLNSFECSICTDTLPEHHHVISTCNHHFCYPCIGRHLLCRDVRSYNCPECRQLMPARDRYSILVQLKLMGEKLPDDLLENVPAGVANNWYLTEFERKIFASEHMNAGLDSESHRSCWDVNAFHITNGSYLEWAIYNNGDFSKQLKLFLLLGIDVNVKNRLGRSPLLAALEPYVNPAIKPEIVRALLDAGADPNIYNEKYDERPLVSALRFTDEHVRVALIRLLLRYGADPNESVEGGTPLHFCTSPADADAFLEHCPTLDINHKNQSGFTPLAKAATSFDFDMLTYWIKKGADIKCPGIQVSPDLLSAMIKGVKHVSLQKLLSVIKLLLKAEGWSSAYDWQSAVESVIPASNKCSSPQLEILKLLLEAGKKAGLDVAGYINTNHLLHGAIKRNDYQLAECLLQTGADISVKDENLKDCLDLVCEGENRSILWLIEYKYPEAGAGQ